MKTLEMKTLKKLVRLICGGLLLFGCSTTTPSIVIPEIDVSKEYPEKEINVQDVAEIEYIPLESTEEMLLDKYNQIAAVTDKRIVAYNSVEGDIFIFGRDGKAISRFNRRDGSAEGHDYIKQIIYDDKSNEVFIYDHRNKIKVYSEKGEYLRMLTIPARTYFKFYNFDEQTILEYDEFSKTAKEDYSTRPYVFISKKDGTTVSTLDFTLPIRYSPRVPITIDGYPDMVDVFNVLILSNNWHDGEDLLIADQSSDTVFQLTKDKRLIPLIARKPSIHSYPPELRIFLTPVIKTEKFIVFEKTVFDAEKLKRNAESISRSNLLYRFDGGEISEVLFKNADCLFLELDFLDINIAKNTGAVLIDPLEITNYLNRDNVEGELKKVALNLKDDDNPVLMIVKFK